MHDQSATPHGPAFLDELAIDAVLDAAVLRAALVGRENIRQLIIAVGGLFRTQELGFRAVLENVEIYEYKATLVHDEPVNGVITVTRGHNNEVVHVGSYMTPLSAVISLAFAVRDAFPEFDKSLFI